MSVETPPAPDIAAVVQSLRAAFDSGVTRDLAWRRGQLAALERMMLENEAEIAEALKADLGKPFGEACTAEIDFVRKEASYARKHLRRWAQPQRAASPLAIQPGQSVIEASPYGVTLIIGAWNYPFQLVLGPLVGAIAAGNCAVVKPSEMAARSSALLKQLVERYLDPRAFTVVEGDADVSTALLAQRFDLIFYTGGEGVGRVVMAAAAQHLTPVVLELGGQNPCIVDETADLAVAARRIVWGRFLNAGQICVAPDHVYVAASVEARLLEELKAAVATMFGPDPKQSPDYGRIINARHTARLQALLADGRAVTGGQADVDDCYVAPTILTEVAADAPILAGEIFGPILPVIPYMTLDAPLAAINARSPALALYAFTKNKATADRIIASTRSGSATINDVVVFMANPNLPFGGVGASGMGAYHGRFSFEAFSHRRAVLRRSFALDASVRYPPFTKGKLALLRRMA
ncbi:MULTISPECIES: aldehyde dehydrogenase family protein [unclassified Brevundimonas]|uniref:aldehyde dehydrogenase family protein n=1 Tax=unclassified Brevundimonas TaxID=2622653 RepID=UPI000CFD09AB|nr:MULTISPECIES: aldehyde dehydrogenase family protein [unclassified Brevundimonas]PRA35973.1 aldehyde dehydrogenase family protein [Brevundimonas sp. MYb27]PQZ84464.1 aldehyde dehydrogenase family protein [Brevundimonas sp. MYb31]PRB17699.1 aldehyde dehydrogenase family protein [Brevundimonas sp. MYb52]PRB38070.1 aldehyde dehydrogenase family protein [Brevundimonas sp. MYb46]PRB56148.1 aldehyde dehydrogenase family protein [Brevundimonas sp. MYb33]